MPSSHFASALAPPNTRTSQPVEAEAAAGFSEDGFGTARPVVPLSRSRCPVVPLAVAVGSQRAAAWRTFAFRRHFGKNEVQ